MQQSDRDLFGNPIETSASIADVSTTVQSTDFENAKLRTPSDDWRSRRDEEPERWDGLS